MLTPHQRRIIELETLLHKISWNAGFGCHNRQGFEHMIWPDIATEARWIIYFDIDGMHALNEKHGGYEPVDAMIRSVLSSVRSSDYLAAQWKSGDEFLVCLTENKEHAPLDPEGLVRRLNEEFARHGMSATFAVVPVKSTDLLENIQPAVDRVYEIKKQRGVSR